MVGTYVSGRPVNLRFQYSDQTCDRVRVLQSVQQFWRCRQVLDRLDCDKKEICVHAVDRLEQTCVLVELARRGRGRTQALRVTKTLVPNASRTLASACDVWQNSSKIDTICDLARPRSVPESLVMCSIAVDRGSETPSRINIRQKSLRGVADCSSKTLAIPSRANKTKSRLSP